MFGIRQERRWGGEGLRRRSEHAHLRSSALFMITSSYLIESQEDWRIKVMVFVRPARKAFVFYRAVSWIKIVRDSQSGWYIDGEYGPVLLLSDGKTSDGGTWKPHSGFTSDQLMTFESWRGWQDDRPTSNDSGPSRIKAHSTEGRDRSADDDSR